MLLRTVFTYIVIFLLFLFLHQDNTKGWRNEVNREYDYERGERAEVLVTLINFLFVSTMFLASDRTVSRN
jgi:hypothetical protein